MIIDNFDANFSHLYESIKLIANNSMNFISYK